MRSAARSTPQRILRGLGIAVAVVAALALAAVAYVYVASGWAASRTYAVPLTTIAVPTDSQAVALGRRLAKTRGCTTCHGSEAEGGVFLDEPFLGRFVAPNLTRAVRERSDAELERVIRHGVNADGTSTLAMPSSMFYHLSDGDLGAILAYLRSLPLSEGPQAEVKPGFLVRVGLVLGMYELQADQIDRDAPRLSASPSDTVGYGRYLAATTCTECHGHDLRGGMGDSAPDLVVAAAYPDTAFVRLMRTGEALGGREVGLMSDIAKGRLRHLTDAELRALHAFFQDHARTRPARRGAGAEGG